MSKEAANNEKTIRDFLHAYNAADAENAISYFADDAIWEDTALGHTFQGKKQIANFINTAHADFSDLRWELRFIFGANNKAVFESVLSGTHTHSSFPGIPVSNKAIEIKAATILEFRNDKIARITDYYNLPPFMQQ